MNRPLDYSTQNSKGLALAVVCVAAFFLVGFCFFSMMGVYLYFAPDRVPGYVLVNNTNQPLAINFIVDGRTYITLSAQAVVVPPPLTDWSFTIDKGDEKKSRYKLAPVERSHVFKNMIYFQIEQDGNIYLLTSPTDKPIQNLPLQPEGYPLRPQ